MSGADESGIHYLLGHTEHELERLDIQGALYRDITARAMQDAGIVAGMRVLDIGCGTGDVSLTAAELVGEGGEVVGIDRGEEAISAARANAAARGLDQARFAVSEIDDFEDDLCFDALVGRFVLMHQSEPWLPLAKAAALVRPGGIVLMIESYMQGLLTGGHSEPHSQLYDEIVRWKCAVVGGAGADLRAGGRLRETFVRAGLPAPYTRLEASLQGGPESPYYRYIAQSVRSMIPEARRQELGGFTEADVEGLEQRLRDDVVGSGGVLVAWPAVAAWCRKE